MKIVKAYTFIRDNSYPTREEIARHLNSRVQYVDRLISRLKFEGLIVSCGNRAKYFYKVTTS